MMDLLKFLMVLEKVGHLFRVMIEEINLLVKTTEKKRISDLCCTGLYHFNNYLDFCNSFNNYLSLPKNKWEKGEIYVAPLYNWLINSGKRFVYIKVPKNLLSFFGTPDEYNNFLKKLN